MKKTMALLLAIMMCLSLCACGGENGQASAGTSKSAEAYASALQLLEESAVSSEQISEKIKEAYDLLISLEDYEDTQAYLSKITQKEVCVEKEVVGYDAFGQVDSIGSQIHSYGYNYCGLLTYEKIYPWQNEYYSEYNSDGQIMVRTCYNNGNIKWREEHSYDKNSLCVSINRTYNDGQISQVFLEYDSDEKIIKEAISDDRDIVYTYDKEGRIFEKTWLDELDGLPLIVHKYSYAQNGTISKVEEWTYGGEKYAGEYLYTYEGEKLASIEFYSESKQIKNRETYTYETLYFYNP